MAAWDTRRHLDHYVVLECLRREPAKELMVYLCKSRLFPLQPLRHYLVLAPDKLFSELKTQIPNPPLCDQVRQACIYDETWVSIDARVTARREGGQKTVWRLSRRISTGLSMY